MKVAARGQTCEDLRAYEVVGSPMALRPLAIVEDKDNYIVVKCMRTRIRVCAVAGSPICVTAKICVKAKSAPNSERWKRLKEKSHITAVWG